MTKQNNPQQGIRFLVTVAALVIIIVGINQAQSVLVAFLVAVFLAMLGTAPVLWLERKRIPSVVAELLVVAGMIGVLLIAGAIVGASVNSFYGVSWPFCLTMYRVSAYDSRHSRGSSRPYPIRDRQRRYGNGRIHGR
jgi:hypothetical protein